MTLDLTKKSAKIVLKVVPIFIAALLLLTARLAEQVFMPVVKDFHLTSVQREGNHVIMSGYMRKVRDCRYVGVSAEGVTGENHVDLPLKFLDSSYPMDNATRPQGTQDWGPWKIVLPVSPSITSVRLQSVHACHPAWETTTKLASVPLIALLEPKGVEQ